MAHDADVRSGVAVRRRRAVVLFGVLFSVGAEAGAAVVCVKQSGAGGPVRVRPSCKSNETELGPVAGLQALLASSSSPDGGATLQLTGNIQLASPIGSGASALAMEAARPEALPAIGIGDSTHFCSGGPFPGELGNQFACASDAGCNNICVAGENSVLGGAGGYHCSTDSECNTALKADGRCASTATCQEFAILSIQGSDLIFSNFNVHVRNGSGATDGPINGRGNLIIGYNEDISGDARTGSHNVVVGQDHAYSSYGGLVAGFHNAVMSASASVCGGSQNTASGFAASVSGGIANVASGGNASVSGGAGNRAGPGSPASPSAFEAPSICGGNLNQATGLAATVCGGQGNYASGLASSVSGGSGNLATDTSASVAGGLGNLAGPGTPRFPGGGPAPSVSGGYRDHASGFGASVSGGGTNLAGGNTASVSGGHLNEARGVDASVSGGEQNLASGNQSSVGGGTFNTAAGHLGVVTGGFRNSANGDSSLAGGGNNNSVARQYAASFGGCGSNNSTDGVVVGGSAPGVYSQLGACSHVFVGDAIETGDVSATSQIATELLSADRCAWNGAGIHTCP